MSASNSERLRVAYQRWHDSKGADTSMWLALAGENIRIYSTGGGSEALSFAGERQSRSQLVAYLDAILKDWAMVHYNPHTFVAEGDRVAVFSRCGWSYKATGKSVEVDIAHLWRFDNGRIVEMTEIFDTARAASAAIA